MAPEEDPARSEVHPMPRRSMHRPLVWSPLVAAVVQLVLAAAAAANTGGSGFPGT